MSSMPRYSLGWLAAAAPRSSRLKLVKTQDRRLVLIFDSGLSSVSYNRSNAQEHSVRERKRGQARKGRGGCRCVSCEVIAFIATPWGQNVDAATGLGMKCILSMLGVCIDSSSMSLCCLVRSEYTRVLLGPSVRITYERSFSQAPDPSHRSSSAETPSPPHLPASVPAKPQEALHVG